MVSDLYPLLVSCFPQSKWHKEKCCVLSDYPTSDQQDDFILGYILSKVKLWTMAAMKRVYIQVCYEWIQWNWPGWIVPIEGWTDPCTSTLFKYWDHAFDLYVFLSFCFNIAWTNSTCMLIYLVTKSWRLRFCILCFLKWSVNSM